MQKIIRSFVFTLAVLSVVSCNLFTPFASNSSAQDYVEAAQKCLATRDYACAITNYNAMPAGDLKNQKLCLVYLAKAGIGISTVLSIMSAGGQTMLGSLANGLLPWGTTKQTDLDTAAINCAYYKNNTTSLKAGQLLNVIAVMSHCAIRVAKTDTHFASDNTSGTCGQIRAGNGTVSKSDVDDSLTGVITTQGMCVDDVISCSSDIAGLDAAELNAAGLSALADALNAIPDNLPNGADNDIKRKAIEDCVP